MGRIDTYPEGTQYIPFTGQTLGYVESITSQTGVSSATEIDITGLSVSVTVPAGRKLKITYYEPNITHSVNNDIFQYYLYDGVTQVGFRQVNVTGSGDINGEGTMSRVLSPSAGTHTFKATVRRFSGSGVANLFRGPVSPAYILVEDITGYTTNAPALSLPVGVIAQTSSTTSVTGVTGTGTLLSTNIVVPAGRLLKITAGANVKIGVTNGRALGEITLDGVGVGRWFDHGVATAATYTSGSDSVLVSPSAGAHTIAMTYNALGNTTDFEASATQPMHLFVEDVTPTPASANTAPSSTLAYAEITADTVNNTTGMTDAPGLAVTVTVAAGRRIRISAEALLLGDTNGTGARLLIGEGSNILRLADRDMEGAKQEEIHTDVILTPSAGTHTYKVAYGRWSGGGNIKILANGQYPAYILVEDITANTVTPVVTTAQYLPITLGYVENFSGNLTFGSSYVDLAGNVTINVPAGRRIRISGKAHISSNEAGNRLILAIREGSTVLNDTYVTPTTPALGEDAYVSAIVSPSAGSHTYKLSAIRNTGTSGVGTVYSVSGDSMTYLLVEDITGSGLPVTTDSIPVGVIAQVTGTVASDPTMTTSMTQIQNQSVNVVVPAGRLLKVSAFVDAFYNSNASGSVIWDIWMDGGRLNEVEAALPSGATVFGGVISALVSPSAGSHTFQSVARHSASTTMKIGTNAAPQLWVEDVTPTPAPANNAASSTLGYAVSNADQSGISGGITLITGLSSTVTIPAGRRIKLTFHAEIGYSDATTGFFFEAFQDGVDTARFAMTPRMATSDFLIIEGSVVLSPAAGTRTFDVRAQRYLGSGTLIVYGSVIPGAYLLVEDITGVSMPSGFYPNGSVPVAAIGDSGWQALPLQNGWVSYDNTYGPNGFSGSASPPSMRKIGNIVFLRGLVKNGNVSLAIATLPVGFRPVMEKTRVTTTSVELFTQLDIQGSTGNIIPVTGVNTSWVSLNNITFLAD